MASPVFGLPGFGTSGGGGSGVDQTARDAAAAAQADADKALVVPLVFGFPGVPDSGEATPPVWLPWDCTILAASPGGGAARTAATSDAAFTIYSDSVPGGAGAAEATCTFTAADSGPAVVPDGDTDQALTGGHYVWAAAPAEADATLADVTITVLVRRDD